EEKCPPGLGGVGVEEAREGPGPAGRSPYPDDGTRAALVAGALFRGALALWVAILFRPHPSPRLPAGHCGQMPLFSRADPARVRWTGQTGVHAVYRPHQCAARGPRVRDPPATVLRILAGTRRG